MDAHEHKTRKIYLPLATLDQCSICRSKGSETQRLRFCEACGEKIYCSQGCQKQDWEVHKSKCGLTDRIELKSFYPLLAYLIQLSHVNAPRHPALLHRILGSPNPDNYDDLLTFPDGTMAKVLLLGDQIQPSDVGTPQWWPTAVSDSVRQRLVNRIVAEGHLLPIVLAICLSLVSEMYNTTAVPEGEYPALQYSGRRRVRLNYHRTPIADFGVAKGPVSCALQDRLAYFIGETNEFIRGQDPEDHYWIYFTTTTGEEIFLDCGMGTLNMGTMVHTDDLADPDLNMPELGPVYAFFHDREFRRDAPLFGLSRTENQRFSILRDPQVHQALHDHDPGLQWPARKDLCSLMARIAGRVCSETEKTLLLKFCTTDSFILRRNVHSRAYLRLPTEPHIWIEKDPGEKAGDGTPEEIEAWSNYMKKFNKQYRKGGLTKDGLAEAHEAFKKMPTEGKLRAGAKKAKKRSNADG